MTDILTITELNAYLGQTLETDPALNDTWIQGEISNMTKARSGHWYFTLKDAEAAIKCVMWRGNAARQAISPEAGDQVIVHGYVSVYAIRGDLQFYADFVRSAGVGDLYARYEQLKARLAEAGLFDQAHKQPLPHFPACIGVVTSTDAAAFRDVQNVLQRRYPLAQVLLSPSLVQGQQAPAQLSRALQRLDATGLVDVILLVRGGGSIEDLWAFNDEQLAYAIHAAQTPIIAGVGHETDVTIADFVADQRAPTPSAAAELATPDRDELLAAIDHAGERLRAGMIANLDQHQETIRVAQQTLRLLSPQKDLITYRQRVDELHDLLHTRTVGYQHRLQERLADRHAALYAASPQALMERGYSIVTGPNGQVVRGAGDVAPGDRLTIRVADGEIGAIASETKTTEIE
jgi:exodeoxyribonuclease VII large subunit